MTIQGIDFEGRISDWPRAKALGKVYAISRCVGENGQVDPDYRPNVAGAEAIDIIAGGFHFIARGTAVEHCKLFVDAMGDPAGRLVMVDVETPNFHPTPLAADVRAWFDEYRKHQPDHPVIVYSRENYWASIGNPKIDDPNVVLMTSRYPSPTSTAYPGDTGGGWNDRYAGLVPRFWQYTGSRNLGLGASVDLSAFHGTLAELLALTKGPAVRTFTFDSSAKVGTLTVKGGGHYYLRLRDDTLHGPVDATAFGTHVAFGPVRLVGGGITGPADTRVDGFIVGAEAAFLISADVVFTPASLPVPAPDPTVTRAAVNAALDHVAAPAAAVITAVNEARPR